ncbi:MAG: hypothetical protein A2381_13430 [Bdellovibrionales bacterium RIFOXYB1_FULL_37_110]|nr:MAG: hypothetical protein A2417_08090 [Bdellovibrionales bacterium RIFOXYC1_FULL_37_79]OFZ59447.1 MAG: hypothetical protein A2381_13430 [Bdellovibrionales bacterium RIFOXYB1_FULL_37_110]OFZ64294.1 MAG: hypothetical protein A2577_02555 [Bdellovibrionales bacterium RIFOXYD1_FULL_36_51]
MPSVIGHTLIGSTCYTLLRTNRNNYSFLRLLLLSALASNLPDADVLFHFLNLSHIAFLSHRGGFFHSVYFALFGGIIISYMGYRKEPARTKYLLGIYFCILIILHSIFDAMTEGIGVAFFYPIYEKKLSLPFTPLLPAGFSAKAFIQNPAISRELFIVWIPSMIINILLWFKLQKRQGQYL